MYDKLIMQMVVAGVLTFLVMGSCLVYLAILYSKKLAFNNVEKQFLLYELEQKQLKMSFSERELILEEIARDIHDNIGQIAHLVQFNLHSIKKLSYSIEQTEVIDMVSGLVGRLIQDARHIGHTLDSDFIKNRGLYSVLENETEHINAADRISCNLSFEGDDHIVTAEQQLLVYRIAQQAIHNTLKHANASRLDIIVRYLGDCFEMTVQDNGIGFDESSLRHQGNTGLNNMRKRARLLNGELEIISAPGEGCRITLNFSV